MPTTTDSASAPLMVVIKTARARKSIVAYADKPERNKFYIDTYVANFYNVIFFTVNIHY